MGRRKPRGVASGLALYAFGATIVSTLITEVYLTIITL